MENKAKVYLFGLLIFLFVWGLWMIDLSASALISGGEMTNIFFRSLDPVFTYHAGLTIVSLDFIISVFWLAFSDIL